MFIWSEKSDESLRILKENLISTPILTCPNYEKSKSFFVQTGSSDFGLGAVFTQETDYGIKVICYL